MQEAIKQIDATSLNAFIQKGESPQIVDVRPYPEFIASHIESSSNIPLSHLKKGIEAPPFTLEELRSLRADKRATIRSMIEEVRVVLSTIKSERPYIRSRVESANAMIDFVLIDRSMGLHNFEKASEVPKYAIRN